MKVKNQEHWSVQESELSGDELGQRWLEIFGFWFDTAEKVMKEPNEAVQNQPLTAMRIAMMITEEQFGYLSPEWIGQMLLVACAHWEHGEQLEEGLTVIERRLVEVETAKKLVALQTEASSNNGNEIIDVEVVADTGENGPADPTA